MLRIWGDPGSVLGREFSGIKRPRGPGLSPLSLPESARISPPPGPPRVPDNLGTILRLRLDLGNSCAAAFLNPRAGVKGENSKSALGWDLNSRAKIPPPFPGVSQLLSSHF